MARKSGTQRRSDRNKRKLTSSKNKLQKITDRLEYLNLNRENLLSRNPRHSSRYRKEFKNLLNKKRLLTSKISSKEALLINQQAGSQNLENIDAEQDRLWGDYRDREIAIENENKDELAISTLNDLKQNKVVNTAENSVGPPQKSVQDSGRGGSVKVDGKALMDQLQSENRQDWLDKTRNSAAAKSGAFTDEQRWQQQLYHREWKEKRKNKKKLSIKD